MKALKPVSIILFLSFLAIITGCKKKSTSDLVHTNISILTRHTWQIDSVVTAQGTPDQSMPCYLNCYLVFLNDSTGYFDDSTSVCPYYHSRMMFKYVIDGNGYGITWNYTLHFYGKQGYDIHKINDSVLVLWNGLVDYVYKPR